MRLLKPSPPVKEDARKSYQGSAEIARDRPAVIRQEISPAGPLRVVVTRATEREKWPRCGPTAERKTLVTVAKIGFDRGAADFS